MEHWRRIVETLPQLVWTATRDGLPDYFSPRICAFTGLPAETLLGTGWLDALHPDDRVSAHEGWAHAVARGSEYRAEHRLRRFDGEYRWFSYHGVPTRDGEGEVIAWVGEAIEITERKELEARFQKSAERWDLVRRLSKGSFWEYVLRDGLVENSCMAPDRFTWAPGFDPADLASMDFRTSAKATGVFPEDYGRFVAAIQACVDGETPEFHFEVRLRQADGATAWRLVRGVTLRDANGAATGFMGTATDVSELKRVEAEKRQATEFVSLATRLSGVYIWSYDLDGPLENAYVTYIDWESLGYDQPDHRLDYVSSVKRVIVPEDQEGVMSAARACLRGETAQFSRAFRIVGPGGELRWNLGRGIVTRDANGAPLKFLGTSIDITDQKVLEQRLRESEERWRNLAETLPQIVFTTGPDGAADYFNGRIEEYTGRPASELLGANWASVIHPDDVGFTLKAWTEAVAGQCYHEAEHRFRRHDGVYRWFTTRAEPVRDADGRVYKWFGTSTDITSFKTIEADLQAAREAAERANRAKDEFLANVSHEIRTPMNAILGMTEIALESARSDDQKQLLATVKSAAKNLLGIIDDLLDFSKIAAGKLALDVAEFGLRAEIGDTLRALTPRADRKGLALRCRVHPDVPDALVGDAGRLRQVLMNLVGNALKFTAEGEIVVVVTLAPDVPARDDADVSLTFDVRDTGIGIARDKQAAIFRAFEQEDASTTRRYGGTGLGLTIAAQLTALMNGTITVDSEPGRGSTFTFTARFGRPPRSTQAGARSPTALTSPPAAAPAAHQDILGAADVVGSAAAAPLRILVAEDNELNAALLKTLLGKRGHRAEFAADGRIALKLAAASAFDLVLLDLHMPELDGFEVAGAIRERERATGTHLPIVALTARSSRRDRDRCLAAGMDDFLAKPIEAGALWAAIDRIAAAYPLSVPRAPRLLDPHAIRRACASDPEVFAALRDVFCRALPDHATSIRAALSDRDLPRIARAAHNLVGTLGAFSTVAASVAAAIEDAAQCDDFASCVALVEQLEPMCAELLDETRALTAEDLLPRAGAR